MASATEAGMPGTYAPPSAQANVIQADNCGLVRQPSSQPDSVVPASGADLAAAFSSFLANQPEQVDSASAPQGMLSNAQLAGILGLLPQQPGSDPPNLQRQGDQATRQDALAPQPPVLKKEDDADRPVGANPAPSTEPQAALPGHQPQLMHVPSMPPPARPGAPQARWAPPQVAGAPWEPYGAAPCGMISQQQPPGSAPSALPMQQQLPGAPSVPQNQGGAPQMAAPLAAAPGQGSAPASATISAAPPHAAGPHNPQQPPGGVPAPGAQMPVHHPAAAAMRGYPYGPYGEPCPYPPPGRPPPGPYHHPGMPGPHGHMMPYHPGFPPLHHLPHRGPYYPHDGRFPPMGPCHPGYPPSGYFRAHPGMPPHPHPAYHFMPPPYGGPHPAMHLGMYHPPPAGIVGPGGPQPMEPPHPRDGTASAASAGTAVCTGAGSDGGSDPASAHLVRPVKHVNGSTGGSESEEVGLEAVITLRPGLTDQEDASGPPAPADGAAALAVGSTACTDAAGRPMRPSDSAATVGPGGELMQESGPPPVHMHKMAPWPHMVHPPPQGLGGPMPSVGSYEWPPPPGPAMMPGYPPMHPQGGWVYPYDPIATAMHHPNMLMGGDLDDDVGLEMHPGARRRPSQSSLGGVLNPGMPPQQRKMPYLQSQQPGFSMMFAVKQAPSGDQQQQSSSPDLPGQSGGAPGSVPRSGSMGQLFSALTDSGGTCYVSRRTQRLKKRRSNEQQPGATPDPFALAVAAAERAAMGRDSSTGSGAPLGLPPMFPSSGGGPRRSSNGSDRTALQGRTLLAPSSRQRSDPGYLIEGPDQAGGWGPGAGAVAGPMAGLGQLVHYPQQLQQQSLQQPILRRTSENGSGGGRAINLPKRFEDAIMTLEYPMGQQPVYVPPSRKPGRPASQAPRAFDVTYDLHSGALPLERPQYEEEHEESEGQEYELEEGADDSDEDYEAGNDRRGFRSSRGGMAVGIPAVDVATRKRKTPMTREEPPQPEKKRKARDPATISKVVINCVIILRMVGTDLVYEKEIRNALGNNPDTSKALRLLMNQGKLVRTGQGGRGNPFCYRCTNLGITTLQRIDVAATPGADPSAPPNQEQRAAAVAV